ncbi:hypothetical protein F5H01DRAFT_354184 [Linnemannia elongata]|nr:hypothetical protein F5H01DRAFT_354184 [Linnemannia elongata]
MKCRQVAFDGADTLVVLDGLLLPLVQPSLHHESRLVHGLLFDREVVEENRAILDFIARIILVRSWRLSHRNVHRVLLWVRVECFRGLEDSAGSKGERLTKIEAQDVNLLRLTAPESSHVVYCRYDVSDFSQFIVDSPQRCCKPTWQFVLWQQLVLDRRQLVHHECHLQPKAIGSQRASKRVAFSGVDSWLKVVVSDCPNVLLDILQRHDKSRPRVVLQLSPLFLRVSTDVRNQSSEKVPRCLAGEPIVDIEQCNLIAGWKTGVVRFRIPLQQSLEHGISPKEMNKFPFRQVDKLVLKRRHGDIAPTASAYPV